MHKLLVPVIIVGLLLILFMILTTKKESFNNSFYDSVLEVDMDYIKNNKGYTLNDYILDNHITYGSGIDSPIPF